MMRLVECVNLAQRLTRALILNIQKNIFKGLIIYLKCAE
jgi:hypothetical protein